MLTLRTYGPVSYACICFDARGGALGESLGVLDSFWHVDLDS